MSRTTAAKSTVTTGGGRVIAVPGGSWPENFSLAFGDYANDVGSCVCWYDAADLTTLFVDQTQTVNASASGDAIGEIQDKSNAAVPAHVQADGTSENWATLVTNKRNGLPGIYFNGDAGSASATRYVTYTGLEDVLADYSVAGMSIIAVLELDDSNEDPAATLIATCRNNLADQRGFNLLIDTTDCRLGLHADIGAGAGSNPPTNTAWRYDGNGPAANEPAVLCFRVTDATPDTEQADMSNVSSLYADVATSSVVSTPTLPTTHLLSGSSVMALGSQHNSSFANFNGWLHELIIFDKTLSNEETNLLMNVLRMKWDI